VYDHWTANCRARIPRRRGYSRSLHVIPEQEFLRVRMQIHLLVHPAGNGIPIHGLEQPMLGPVCSYVSDTIGGSNPCL
jgi:hypothetical protein